MSGGYAISLFLSHPMCAARLSPQRLLLIVEKGNRRNAVSRTRAMDVGLTRSSQAAWLISRRRSLPDNLALRANWHRDHRLLRCSNTLLFHELTMV